MMDTETAITMHGEVLVWRRGDGGKWVGVFGPLDAVHFYERNGTWVGRRPRALEALATSKTLKDCVGQVLKIYKLRKAENAARIAAALKREAMGYIR